MPNSCSARTLGDWAGALAGALPVTVVGGAAGVYRGDRVGAW